MSTSRDSTADAGAVFKEDNSPKRILLVENNNLNRQMLKACLVVYGYQVLSWADGSSFFQTLASFQPHIISRLFEVLRH